MDKDFAPKDGTDAVKDPAGGGKWEQLVSPHQGDVAKTEAEREAQAIEEAKAAATEELASRLHDVWREQYKREHGTTSKLMMPSGLKSTVRT